MTAWSKNTRKGRLRLPEELRAPSAPPGCRSQLKPRDRCFPQDISHRKPLAIKTASAFTGKFTQNSLRESLVPISDGGASKANQAFERGHAPLSINPNDGEDRKLN